MNESWSNLSRVSTTKTSYFEGYLSPSTWHSPLVTCILTHRSCAVLACHTSLPKWSIELSSLDPQSCEILSNYSVQGDCWILSIIPFPIASLLILYDDMLLFLIYVPMILVVCGVFGFWLPKWMIIKNREYMIRSCQNIFRTTAVIVWRWEHKCHPNM